MIAKTAVKEAKSAPVTPSPRPARAAWEVVVEIGSQIPDEEWERVPEDASIQYRHYLYDTAKKPI